MPNMLILPPHKIWSRGSTVAGTVDSTYEADWLTDGASSRPIRGTGGSHAYAVTFPAAGTVNFCSLINASGVSVDTEISGGVSATIQANAEMPDGIRYNGFSYFADVAGVTGVTVTITGNPLTIIAGEFVAGEAFECERHIYPGGTREFYAQSIPRSDEFDFLPDYDLNAQGRSLSCETVVTEQGVVDLEYWWRGQRGRSRMGVIVPTPSINDAWWGRLTAFTYRKQGPSEFRCSLAFRESAMVRWQ